MRDLTLTIILFAALSSACDKSDSPAIESREAAGASSPTTAPGPEPIGPWLPQAVETCISSVRDHRRVAPASDFNPFYLNADFDSDGVVDIAVLVRSEAAGESRTNGLLMCMENRETGRFGAAFFEDATVTSFERDNFVTPSWEIIPRGRLRDQALDGKGRPLLQGVSKGDVVGFFHEGGTVFVYWDGSRFKAAEGS